METTKTADIARAIGLTVKALDRNRSEAERAELTIEALALLSNIATD